MSRFADPDTVACPNCRAHFYRKVPKSISMHYHIEFSDGGVKSFLKEMLPELGRCQSCNFIIEDIAKLEVIEENIEQTGIKRTSWQNSIAWLQQFLARQNDDDASRIEWKYHYLPAPSYAEYAELYSINDTATTKRLWAIQACRVFHQQFCLSPGDQKTIYRKEGYRTSTTQEQEQYKDMVNYLHAHPFEPLIDEFTIFRAELYRINSEYALAQTQYELVKDSEFDGIIELSNEWCDSQNRFLIIVERQGRH